MKTGGWILLVLGILSTLWAIIGGIPPIGGLFFAILGAYLISRANKKEKEQRDKDKWLNS